MRYLKKSNSETGNTMVITRGQWAMDGRKGVVIKFVKDKELMMGTECQLVKMKSSGDLLYINVNRLTTTELYT